MHTICNVLLLGFALWLPLVSSQNVGVITKYTENVVGRVGGSAVLNCTATRPQGSSHFVEWFFLNATGGGRVVTSACKVVEEHNVITGVEKYKMDCITYENNDDELYSLTINLLSIPDNGIYQCRVRISGQAAAQQSMNVKLTVLSPPKMVTSTSDIQKDAFMGMDVTLNCFAEGVPSPNVTWGRADGRPLPNTTLHRALSYTVVRTDTLTHQRLEIYNLTKDDRGTYRCSADNNIRPPDEISSRLSIQFPPTVSPVEPSYGGALGEGNQAMIWCKVEGNPRPTMSWFKLNPEDSKRLADGRLVIDRNFLEGTNVVEILSDEKYKVEQKIMTVGSLSTMESMFYSLTVQAVEANDLVFYVCRAENNQGDGWSVVDLYLVNDLAASTSLAKNVSYPSIFTIVLLLALSLCITT